MKIYFEYPDDATKARAELVSVGVPERDVTIDVHKGGGGFENGLRRFAGDPSSQNTHGATLIIGETDWLARQKIEQVVRVHNGRISD